MEEKLITIIKYHGEVRKEGYKIFFEHGSQKRHKNHLRKKIKVKDNQSKGTNISLFVVSEKRRKKLWGD